MKKTVLTSLFCIYAFLNQAVAAEDTAVGDIMPENPPAENKVPAENKPSAAEEIKKDPCERFQRIKPLLRLRSSYGKLSYNYDYDRDNLDIMAARNQLAEEGMFTAGLSLVDVDWSVSLNTVSRSVGDHICVIPASVDVFIGYRNPVIYISNDLEQGSCPYQVVLRHERQHQQVNIAVLDYYLPVLKKGFAAELPVLKARALKEGEDTDSVTDDMNAEYAEAVRPLINRFQITLQLEQQRLDNRENYQYESRLCR